MADKAQEEEKKVDVAPKRTTYKRASKIKPSNIILIENLPENFSRLMLE